MGKIIGVSSVGKLQIQLEDDSISEFAIKEVSFAKAPKYFLLKPQ